MDLADLRIFSAVVKEGGITRAARRLHRVQSNVTTRIRQLETDLGAQLFIREGRRLHLAPAGRILSDYTDRLLQLADEAREAVQDTTPRGLFRLGAMESTAGVRLPEPLTQYNRRYPEVTLELSTGNPTQLTAALLDGSVDAALMSEPIDERRFDSVDAFKEEVVIVTSTNRSPTDNRGGNRGDVPRTMLVFEQGCPHRRRLESWYAAKGAAPERTIELGSYHAMLGCVVAGMGAALLPKSILGTFPHIDMLRILRLPKEFRYLKTLLVWRKGVSSSKVQALIDVL